MPTCLEIVEGPAKGRKIELQSGKTVTIGRTARSMVIVKEDDCLSGQHLTVGVRNGSVLLCNLSKTNGTEVDGKRVETHVLKPGERFKAGASTFAVVAPPNPHLAVMRLGGWGLQSIPAGWELAGESRLHRPAAEGEFRPNILAAEECLPNGHTLKTYVGLQIQLGQKHIPGTSFKDPVEAKIQGAEEAMALSLTAQLEGKGPAVQHQIYALHAGVVGVLTATALQSQSQVLREALATVLKGLSFSS